MKHNPVAKNAHKFNKSQVMKDRKKAMKKGERKHKGKMDEKLSASDDAGEWVKDFRKSDAPQFKGKSDKKKQQMAIAAYLDAKREKREAMEEKKGLWHNIHQKRKRGERPAKPGEKGYPKTLDIEEDEDPCWKGYKQLGMKKKGGKQVPNCVPEAVEQIQEKSVHVRLDHLDGDPRQKKVTDVLKKYEKSRAIEFDGETDKGAIFKVLKPAMITGLNRDLKPFATSAVNESISEWACNRTEKTRRVAGGDKRKKYMKEKQVEEGSAQDRLNKRAAKLGIGNRNKAADDYIANLMKKYGAKDMADLKKKMNEEKLPTAVDRQMKKKEAEAERKKTNAEVRAARKDQQRNDVNTKVNEELTPVQKRKYMNLKKRAKAGNSQAKIRLKSFEKEFAKELDMERGTAAKTKKAVRGKGAADPHSGQAFSGSGGGSGDDKNIVTQLRKAQDMDGKMDIELARGKKVRAPKSLIDKILGRFDQLQKPQDKKKFMDLVTKELMKKAK